jgi:signal transduction histidine kinase
VNPDAVYSSYQTAMGSPFTTPLARARQAWQAFNTQPRLLQAAYLLSAIPLLVGTWIFFTWLITRQEWLQVAGFITICLGLVAVFSAFICLKMHNDLQWDDAPEKARRIRRNTWFVRTLMVSNFVLALVYMEAAFHAGSGYKVVIINETAKTIDRLTLNSPGRQLELGALAPGQQISQTFSRFRYPTYTFAASQGYKQILGRVTGEAGRCDIVYLKADGTYETRDDRGTW